MSKPDLEDFSIEHLGVLRWRVLYQGKDWVHEHTGALPMREWCPTRKWAIRKARRLGSPVHRRVFPVYATDEQMRMPIQDLRSVA